MILRPNAGHGLLILEVSGAQRRTKIGRTTLDEGLARRRGLYRTAHNTHNKHPCSRRYSNPQSQQASGYSPTPYAAQPLGPAKVYLLLLLLLLLLLKIMIIIIKQKTTLFQNRAKQGRVNHDFSIMLHPFGRSYAWLSVFNLYCVWSAVSCAH
jgi:hypothetical protein